MENWCPNKGLITIITMLKLKRCFIKTPVETMNRGMFPESGPLKKCLDLLWEKLFHSLPQGVSKFHYAGCVEMVWTWTSHLLQSSTIYCSTLSGIEIHYSNVQFKRKGEFQMTTLTRKCPASSKVPTSWAPPFRVSRSVKPNPVPGDLPSCKVQLQPCSNTA